MKTADHKRTPFRAWAASLPLALAIPAVFWIIEAAFTSEAPSSLNSTTFLIIGIAIVVHLLGYLITGLPIFLTQYKNLGSCVWMLPVSLVLGAALGTVMLCFSFIFFGYPFSTFRKPECYLYGAGYGLITAFAAFRQRPIPA